jgi:hypothetical protein
MAIRSGYRLMHKYGADVSCRFPAAEPAIVTSESPRRHLHRCNFNVQLPFRGEEWIPEEELRHLNAAVGERFRAKSPMRWSSRKLLLEAKLHRWKFCNDAEFS